MSAMIASTASDVARNVTPAVNASKHHRKPKAPQASGQVEAAPKQPRNPPCTEGKAVGNDLVASAPKPRRRHQASKSSATPLSNLTPNPKAARPTDVRSYKGRDGCSMDNVPRTEQKDVCPEVKKHVYRPESGDRIADGAKVEGSTEAGPSKPRNRRPRNNAPKAPDAPANRDTLRPSRKHGKSAVSNTVNPAEGGPQATRQRRSKVQPVDDGFVRDHAGQITHMILSNGTHVACRSRDGGISFAPEALLCTVPLSNPDLVADAVRRINEAKALAPLTPEKERSFAIRFSELEIKSLIKEIEEQEAEQAAELSELEELVTRTELVEEAHAPINEPIDDKLEELEEAVEFEDANPVVWDAETNETVETMGEVDDLVEAPGDLSDDDETEDDDEDGDCVNTVDVCSDEESSDEDDQTDTEVSEGGEI